MLTPNRKGLSALPGDIFYTLNMDVNYQAGLIWSRDPQFRLIYHPTANVAAGLSIEAPEQYIGGSGGGGVVTLPAAFQPNNYFNLVNNGTTVFLVPNLHPDFIGKIAWDKAFADGRAMHLEVAGIVRSFKVYNPNSRRHFGTVAGGGSLNFSFDIVKNLKVLSNNYWSDGGGRWIFGLAPDLIVRGDGSLSPVHAGSTVSGLEGTWRNTQLFGYYGGVYIGRNVAQDFVSGAFIPIGYGYSGSPNTQNRAIQQITGGFIQSSGRIPSTARWL
jgi:hypothetical protein